MVKAGEIHNTNDGPIEVVAVNSATRVEVRFLQTGYSKVCQSVHVTEGRIKDKLKPRLFGVGFVGDGDYPPNHNKKAYTAWQSMLQRCYDASYHKARPTYIGCEVCDEWHNFQHFAEWYSGRFFDGAHLDKDLSSYGDRGKLYSPETCALVSRQVNGEEAHAKHYMLVNPDGDTVSVYNLKRFCSDNNLPYKNMNALFGGHQKSCRGWRKAP